MKPLFLLLLFLTSFSITANEISAIQRLVDEHIRNELSPSIALAIIKNGKTVHISATGDREIKKSLKTSINTPYAIGSVSKVITSLAVFKLVEQGKISLEEDINKYLPFNIQNPHIPKDRITVGQLLNHKSGIFDNKRFLFSPMLSLKGDYPIALEDFLASYLFPKGQLYSDDNFREGVHAKAYKYSNIGYALLGLIVEQVAGQPFNEFCNDTIFKPLGLQHTRWFLNELELAEVAKTYVKEEVFKSTGTWGVPDYPSGNLRTSIYDFSILFNKLLNTDGFVLSAKTIDRFAPKEITETSHKFTWFKEEIGGDLYYQHDGAVFGGGANVVMDRKNKNAIIMFTNNDDFPWKLFNSVAELAFE